MFIEKWVQQIIIKFHLNRKKIYQIKFAAYISFGFSTVTI